MSRWLIWQRHWSCCCLRLRSLRGLADDDHPSVKILKAEMRVYYALLQGDTVKCRSAMEAMRRLAHELLDDVMEGCGRQSVVVLRPKSDSYFGVREHTDENARQLGDSFKNSLDGMETLCTAMERLRA